ncbi:hypothetical protein [Porphyrobacter sp. HT-58-2]|uniref:hypothetical protein n=1 Tax=Porphyrobacter sp. HT-58-2 TaxID=2023229 RepID=UPI0011B04905|nr:hypothetical protein [Porphyrobacter sp. HT-58-2]
MIVEFVVIVMLGAVVAATLARTGRPKVLIATLAGTTVGLITSVALKPLPPFGGSNFLELLLNRVVICSAFALLAAALGTWSRREVRKPE